MNLNSLLDNTVSVWTLDTVIFLPAAQHISSSSEIWLFLSSLYKGCYTLLYLAIVLVD